MGYGGNLTTLSPILLSEAIVTIETKKEQIIFIFHTILQPERGQHEQNIKHGVHVDATLIPFFSHSFFTIVPPQALPPPFPPWP
jgi:hypothetical protein